MARKKSGDFAEFRTPIEQYGLAKRKAKGGDTWFRYGIDYSAKTGKVKVRHVNGKVYYLRPRGILIRKKFHRGWTGKVIKRRFG
jgi:hypothetical protein